MVGGSYFKVMGLHPVIGRLLDPTDDGPQAAGAAALLVTAAVVASLMPAARASRVDVMQALRAD